MYLSVKKTMTLVVVVLSAVCCSNSSSRPAVTGSQAAANDAASQQETASFSCLIDGQSFSSKGTDGLANCAFKTAPDILNLSLVSMDPKYKGTVPPQIALFFSPGATTTIKGNNGKYTAKYSPGSQLDNDYFGDEVVVKISSLTATRIAGTFSGKFSSSSKTINITDGQFDLPKSKYSQPLK